MAKAKTPKATEFVGDSCTVTARHLQNGDKIRVVTECPFTEDAWAALAPFAMRRVKVYVDVANQVDIDEAEGQTQLPGTEGE